MCVYLGRATYFVSKPSWKDFPAWSSFGTNLALPVQTLLVDLSIDINPPPLHLNWKLSVHYLFVSFKINGLSVAAKAWGLGPRDAARPCDGLEMLHLWDAVRWPHQQWAPVEHCGAVHVWYVWCLPLWKAVILTFQWVLYSKIPIARLKSVERTKHVRY